MRKRMLAGLFSFLPVLVHSQTSANVNLLNIGYTDVSCTNGQSTQVSAPASLATSCSALGGRLNLSGSASNLFGILRSETSLAVGAGSTLPIVRATADAAWNDDVLRFSVAPGTIGPARVELRYLFTGVIGGDNIRAFANVEGQSVAGSMALSKSNVDPGGRLIPLQSFSEDFLWNLTVPNGGNSVAFYVLLSTGVQAIPGADPALGYSDFSHTFGLTQLTFFDTNGNDISNNLSYDFASGTRFLAATTVPEPASSAMILAGFICVGVVARGRSRRNSV